MVATVAAHAAIEYAEDFGWPVFPVGRNKRPLTKNGFKDATQNVETIARYWSDHPDSNIGIPTGHISGFDVLDIDAHRGGDATVDELIKACGALGEPPQTRTGGGGRHLLYRHREGVRNRTDVVPGVDVRGDGGYVVMPPSVHPSGSLYRWLHEPDSELPEWPQWLGEKIIQPTTLNTSRYGHKALDEECAKIRGAKWGQQEAQLSQSALKIGGLVASGELEFNAAFQALVESGCMMSNQPGKPPWTTMAIQKKVTDRLVAGFQRPRVPVTSTARPSQPMTVPEAVTVDEIKSPSELMVEYGTYIDGLNSGQRLQLGFTALDQKLRSICPGEVVTVIARSGVGKTAFLQNILLNITSHPTLFCSMEQPLPQCAERYIQMILNRDGRDVEAAFSDPAGRTDVGTQVAEMLGHTYTIGRSGLALEDVSDALDAASEKAGAPIGVVALDYLGMMDTGTAKQYEGISKAARGIKSLAKNKQVVVVILCQVNRQAGEAGNWPLTLSSARDSGAIEEAADYMLGLYRPHFDPHNLDSQDNVLAIQILKNRKGFLGEFRYTFDRTSLRIRDEVVL